MERKQQLLSLREAAAVLRRSVPSLRRDIRSRRIDTVRVVGSVRIPLTGIDKLIARSLVPALPEEENR